MCFSTKHLNIVNYNCCGADTQAEHTSLHLGHHHPLERQGLIQHQKYDFHLQAHVFLNPKSHTILTLWLILNMCLEKIKGQSVILNLGKFKNISYSSVKKY